MPRHRADTPVISDALWESRYQALQQDHVKLAAEVQRLRQTVAELRAQLPAAALPAPSVAPAEPLRAHRQPRARAVSETAEVEPWIVEAVRTADPQVLPRLEQAAANDPAALEALGLLAHLDNAETLMRVWLSSGLDEAVRQRATLLLAAAIETHPHAEEWIQSLGGHPLLQEAALAGLGTTPAASRLARHGGQRVGATVKTDYALRLRLVEALRAGAADEELAAQAERVRDRLLQRAGEAAAVAP
jgi:cell division septum initiation protein DivIVA